MLAAAKPSMPILEPGQTITGCVYICVYRGGTESGRHRSWTLQRFKLVNGPCKCQLAADERSHVTFEVRRISNSTHMRAGILWRWQQTACGWQSPRSCVGACMRSTAATPPRTCQDLLQASSWARSCAAMF